MIGNAGGLSEVSVRLLLLSSIDLPVPPKCHEG